MLFLSNTDRKLRMVDSNTIVYGSVTDVVGTAKRPAFVSVFVKLQGDYENSQMMEIMSSLCKLVEFSNQSK